jgi:hypothetical protein
VSEKRFEIRIVTGPDGLVQGSEIWVNGELRPNLSFFSVSGEVSDRWKISQAEIVMTPEGVATGVEDSEEVLAEGFTTFDSDGPSNCEFRTFDG